MVTYSVVETSKGKLRGQEEKSVAGGSFWSFKGIPFAKPPVGPLRFKPPQEAEAWEGTRDALQDGHPSPAIHMMSLTNAYVENSSEDCLYLNVYTPQDPTKTTGVKPVMFWIHGGGFNSGSGASTMYGPDYLVTKDVVMVSCNYRLGVLGFLSLQNTKCPGNNGMKDIVAALKWVQTNIAAFGGDPNNITIFGESAGGAAVHYLMLSKMARGLFHKAISLSGTSLNSWAFSKNPAEKAFCLGKLLGFETTNTGDLLEFLQTVPPEDLVKYGRIVLSHTEPEEKFLTHAFLPTAEPDHEGAFISKTPEELTRSGELIDVPYIIGGNNMEGMLAAKGGHTNMKGDTEEDFIKLIPTDLLCHLGNYKSEVVALIRKVLFNNSFDKISYMKALSPRLFWTAIDAVVRSTVNNVSRKSATYLYHFIFDGQCNIYKKAIGCGQFPGACHADDLGYYFHSMQFSPPVEPGSNEHKVIQIFTTLLSNFARSGNPTPNSKDVGVLWEPVSQTKMAHLEISPDPKMKQDPEGDDIQFWKALYEKYKK